MAIPYAPSRLYQPDSSIIDIILQSGREKAQLQRASGQNWGNAVSNLGQIASNTIQDIAERKRKAPLEAAQLKQTQNATELSSLQLGETKKQAERQARRDEAMKLPHRQEALSALQGDPEGQANAAKTFGQMDDYYDSMMGEAAAGIARAGFAPQAFDIALKDLEAKGIDKAKISEYRQIIASDPEQAKALTYQLLSNSPNSKHQAIFAEEQARGLKNLDLEYQRGKDAKTDADRMADNARADKQFAETVRHNRAVESSSEGGGLSLTPAAMDSAAQRYLIDGTLPPMGMGKAGAGVRQRILNRAAELDPTANIAGNKAGYQADAGSLKRLQGQYDAVNAFEGSAKKNAAALDAMLSKVPDSGVRFLNTPLRALASQFGSEDMARMNVLRQSLQNEYARIISNPTLAGVMSDSARKEGEALLAPDLTLGQLKAALETLALEAGNRKSAYGDELGTIKGRMSGNGRETPIPSPVSANPLTVVIQGKTVTFQSKAQLDAWKKAAGVN